MTWMDDIPEDLRQILVNGGTAIPVGDPKTTFKAQSEEYRQIEPKR
jgi:hypothetical protein